MAVSTCFNCELRFSRRPELAQHLVTDHGDRIVETRALPTLFADVPV
jgi:hypothetical protein